ncbi:MAG TPA: shikimate dehydrogenase [Amaricoccus sp.]|nr:shikimate dehydrogenase [Amaricoccus sp.]
MISGKTKVVAHLGYPTESFKAPMIYNPWFEKHGVDAVVVPMGVKSEDYRAFLPLVFRLSNIAGALVTMPHKVTTVELLDEASTTVKVAGACNAVKRDAEGRLVGDMFDGEGFVRGVLRKGRTLDGARALVVGSGGVGSAIAASLAKAGVAKLAVFDAHTPMMDGLAERLRANYPALEVVTASKDPSGFDVVVNATPLGMKEGDPLPMDVERIDPATFVGEVVMKTEITPFLAAARARGCAYQVGTDMLFEQIPAYLEFFGFGSTTADELRSVATISY